MNANIHAQTSTMGQTSSSPSLPTDASPALEPIYNSYRSALSTHLKDRNAARICLLDQHHEVWQTIVSLLNKIDNKDTLNEFLTCYFNMARVDFPEFPVGSEQRDFPKKAERLQRKLNTVVDAQAERSACVDWVACRLLAKTHEFPKVKKQIEDSFGKDVVLVWRSDGVESQGRRDVVEFGYAFKLGGGTVMEVQILEEAAKWVFEMNSRMKHAGEPGCVSFKESKDLYNGIKNVILEGWSRDRIPYHGRVREYYEMKRAAKGASLDYEELDKFQKIVDEVLTRAST